MIRRLPNALLLILVWCLGLGALSAWAAPFQSEPRRSGLLLAYGALHLVLALFLVSLRPLARRLSLAGFGALALAAAGQLVVEGATWTRLSLIGFDLYALLYLLAPSTRELFSGGRPRLSLLGALPTLGLLALALGCGAAGLSTPLCLAVLATGAVCHAWGSSRLWRLLATFASGTPAELAEEERVCFRAARRARWRGEQSKAEGLLEGLRKARGVRILRGLVALDRTDRQPGTLARLVFDLDYVPGASEARALAEACEAASPAELRALVERRAELIDDVLADAGQSRSCFFLELPLVLSRLSGRLATINPESAYRRWWRREGPRQRGDQALRWLVLRLWEAKCFEGAASVAVHVDPVYALAGESARAFAELGERIGQPGWLGERKETLALSSGLAESMGWLLLDGSLGRNAVQLSQLRDRRRDLIQGLRAAWGAYPVAGSAAIPWLLHLLTDLPLRGIRWPSRFDRLWGARRLVVERYEGLLVAGARAAAEEMWEVAEQTYAEAARLLPERSAAHYNRAFALMELGRHASAEGLLLELARRESDEPFWWLRLGDCRRGQGDLRGALAAYQQVLEREGMGGRVALRVGLTLAADGNHQVAERFLDAAVEQIDDPEMIQRLAAVLESEGAYTLAQRYEERAFNDALERGDHEWQGDDSDDTGEAVS